MTTSYQALVEDRIYLGGAADVKDMITESGCNVIVDLREEATECAFPGTEAAWVKVGLGDHAEVPQEELLQKAIDEVVQAYRSGKTVGFHCGGGKGRTGAVAVGTLMALGKASSLEEAERKAKEIRPVIGIKPPQREALEKLFGK
ncbi:protein-tyrosine phosphatase family protein [Paenibacillus mucilaginosus]|uniref:Protein-tyrosine phosphatase n=3 Tax=Paenibacillus mucilaginosus TaxID=61624 RepID=H6N9Q3_9BACL|nr:tyrosine-protein phosphatase [Paenibacillus mucilaginosus]AEI41949.1 protein-tyrosine phosphatase [Paenibacillus mucilaginosus KNP414]AFC28210.1 protein-tyrosine phosphatase [Paenibacillus mucilaginosus 3016]AFH60385.1 protein-tyrosine phosphatase [Paenibacillus mucilaginosus K02]MCG7218098.1 tyrosine-protein phosphatase [Paenibacillus mucilaginosus]WDM28856.1 dual specificity protein phosphatase family protein [Paenibacillus mucilaginosus]